MNRLKRSLSLRSSKRNIPESVRPHVWENDSYKVRNGGVSFPVKVKYSRFEISLYTKQVKVGMFSRSPLVSLVLILLSFLFL